MTTQKTAVLESVNPDGIESLFDGVKFAAVHDAKTQDKFAITFDKVVDEDGHLRRDWTDTTERIKRVGNALYKLPSTAQKFGTRNSTLNAQRLAIHSAMILLERKLVELGVM